MTTIRKAWFRTNTGSWAPWLVGAVECMKFMLPEAGTRSQTFAQVEVGMLQCLSGGTSPLRQDVDFGKIIQAPSLRFEDYVYE